MQIREPWPADAEPELPAEEATPVDAVAFRVSPGLTVLKLALAVVFAAAGLLAGDRVALVLGVAAAVGLIAFAGRDLIAPVRLSADAQGVVAVRGYAARRRLSWSDIDTVRVDERPHLGREVRTLELDTGSELFLFSAGDLGMPPAEAADLLNRVRRSTVEEDGLGDGQAGEEEQGGSHRGAL